MSFLRYVNSWLIAVASFVNSFYNRMDNLEDITKTYFAGESLLFIYWSNVSVEFRHNLMDYWSKSGIVTVETCNCDYVTDDIIWERSYVQNIVVLFGDIKPEQRHIESIRQCRSWNARSKILALVDNGDNIANFTLGKIWALTKALNVTIMMYSTSSVRYYTLYSYYNFTIVELDQNGLFPPKHLHDLHGSIISVATARSQPYAFATDTSNEFNDGIEIRIVNAMAKKFNFQLKFIQPPKGQSPWIAFFNGKIVGNLGLLYRCEADIIFNGLQLTRDRCSLADTTSVHTMDTVVWVVPKRPFTFNWKSIITLFKNELWALLLATLISIAITLYLITKYEFGSRNSSYNFLDAFFQIFTIHLGASIHLYSNRQLYRLFLFTISYYAIVIVALYQSSLITHLTSPGSGDQYNTIDEAVDDGLIGYFFPVSKTEINKTDHDLWNKILQPGKHVFFDDGLKILRYVAENKTVYTIFSRNFVNFEIHKNLLDENHEPMVKIIGTSSNRYMVTIYTSRGHPLRDVINNVVLRLSEAGILEQWMKDILAKNSKAREGASDKDDGPKALTIEHLKGAFYIILIMFSVAGVVFVAEMAYYWWKVKKFCVKK